jgi:hypothetical protein
MPADSAAVTAIHPTARSRVTNGSSLFVDGDGRGVWARRWRDLRALYADDLGGAASLSEFQLGLLGTAATMRCELERLEGRLSVGEAIDTDMYGRIAGHYRRICETLGIERRQRDVTPSVAEYIEHTAAADGDDEASAA